MQFNYFICQWFEECLRCNLRYEAACVGCHYRWCGPDVSSVNDLKSAWGITSGTKLHMWGSLLQMVWPRCFIGQWSVYSSLGVVSGVRSSPHSLPCQVFQIAHQEWWWETNLHRYSLVGAFSNYTHYCNNTMAIQLANRQFFGCLCHVIILWVPFGDMLVYIYGQDVVCTILHSVDWRNFTGG